MLLNSCTSDQHGGDTSDGSQSMSMHQDKKAQTTLFAQRALQERRLKPPEQVIACPRCQSMNTKFCYYNNYSLSQPRHFCKNCRRYWTAGGTLRNVPVGGGCRKNKRAKHRSSEMSSSGLNVESSVSGLRVDGGSSGLHPSFNPASASTSAGYYDQHPYDSEATKMGLSRSIRPGPSGVSQSTEGSGISSNGHVSAFSITGHGSHSTGMSHSAQSTYEPSTSLLGLTFYPHSHKEPLVNPPDLSTLFDPSAAYRAAASAAAAAAGGGGALSESGISYNIDLESLGNLDPEVSWRLQQQVQAAAQRQAKQQPMWGGVSEDDQDHREGRQQLQMQHVDDKGMIDLRQHSKGKSAMSSSPSSGHDQAEGNSDVTRPLMWSEPMQSGGYEPSHDNGAYWPNQAWSNPMDNMQALNSGSTQMI